MKTVTHYTTFYSFKGGVGRTMLLANVGAGLARMGRRVLLWDLDVEAPGMHFIPALTPGQLPAKGFLEWLVDWQEKQQMVLPLAPSHLNELYRRVCEVPRIRNLSILPAFGEKADSAGLYQQIRWQDFLVSDPEKGLQLFHLLLQFLGERGRYDHILMDSRTGVTDLGGLMAAILPHATILVANYGPQNLQGIAGIEEALRPAMENRLQARARIGLQGLNTLLVISPVPGDQDMLREARKLAYDKIFPGRHDTRVEIPFDSRLLFTEEVLTLTEPQSGAAGGYTRVAERVEQFRDSLLELFEDIEKAEIIHSDPVSFRETGKLMKKGQTFEDRVARLLKLLGYEVEREQYVDGNKVDLIAARQSGLRRERYLVECKDHGKPIGKSTLEKLCTWLGCDQARKMRADGMIVARDFSPAAITFAQSRGDLFLYTVQDLENALIDFGPYLAKIRRSFEESGLSRTYVEQRVRLEQSTEKEGVDLLDHALSWATGRRGKKLWLLLGDYGAGKTTFFKRFAYELAKGGREDSPDAPLSGYPVPVAVDLKEFPNAISLEGLLQEHLRKHMDWHGNPEILLYLLEQGKVVFLFDAFDEMGTAAIGRSVEDQFRQLAGASAREGAPGGNRILITCRTHFFRDQQIIKDVMHGEADDLVSRESAIGRLARTFDAAMDELMLFDDAQINDYLARRLSREEAEKARAFIDGTYDLPRLAPRPVLLEMIIESLPELMRAGGDVTPAGLYHRYTSQWLDLMSGVSLQTTPRQRKLLLEFLAQELWGRSQNRIHHRELLSVLEKVPADHLAALDLDRVDLELRTAAFLIRTNDGYYSFSHKSFLEFFLARRILRALRENNNSFAAVIDTAPLTPECLSFLADLFEEDDWPRCRSNIQKVLSDPYRAGSSENAVRLAYRLACAKVREAERNSDSGFGGMVGVEMARFMPQKAQLRGARFTEEYFNEADLSSADLESADLTSCDLRLARLNGTIFRNARMNRANLEHAQGDKADFSGAALKFVTARHGCFAEALFDGADLTAAVFVDTECAAASFRGACCHAARFARSNLLQTDWEGADLTRFTAPDSLSFPVSECIVGSKLEPFICTRPGYILRSTVFSPDGKRLLCAGLDNTAHIFDTKTGQETLTLRGHEGWVNSAIFSPDGRRVLSAGYDSTARIFDATTGKEILTLSGHEGWVNSAVFSPDGGRVLTAGFDGTARIFDAKTEQEILRLRGHEGWVNSAVFSPGGNRILTAGSDGTARIFDAKTGKEILTLRGHLGVVKSAVFSPDTKRVLSAGSDSTARIFDAKTGQEILTLRGHKRCVYTAVFSPDGRRVLTAGEDSTVRIFDAETGREILTLEGHEGEVNSAVFSPGGRRVLSAGFDGTARIFDAETGREILTLKGHGGWLSSAFSPDGKQGLSAGSDSTARIFDAKTGQEILTIRGHEDRVSSAVFSPDGGRVLSAGSDSTARIFDAKTGREILTLQGHGGGVSSAAFSPDGKRVLSAGSDSTARIFDAKTGKKILTLRGHEGDVNSVVFSSDGRRVLSAGKDSTARIFDSKTGQELLILRGHEGWVNSAVFSPDGKRVLSAGSDSTARIFDAKTGWEILTVEGHDGWVNSAVFSPDGRRVLSAGFDGTARIFDAGTGKETLTLRGHVGPVSSAVFSSDGTQVLSAGADSTARIFDAVTGEMLCLFFQDVGGWFSLDARGRYLGEGPALEYLSYFDPNEDSLLRTLWSAEDLPHMRADFDR